MGSRIAHSYAGGGGALWPAHCFFPLDICMLIISRIQSPGCHAYLEEMYGALGQSGFGDVPREEFNVLGTLQQRQNQRTLCMCSVQQYWMQGGEGRGAKRGVNSKCQRGSLEAHLEMDGAFGNEFLVAVDDEAPESNANRARCVQEQFAGGDNLRARDREPCKY